MKLTFKSEKSVAKIFEYLTDMQKFAAVHPVISKIEKLHTGSYLVYETLKVGLLPVSFKYPVSITSGFENKNVTMHAVVMKFTKINLVFNLRSENGFTIIDETINFKSPLPVSFIMEKIFIKHHTQLFKNIEADTIATS